MKALALIVALSGAAGAAPVEDVVREQLAPALPADTDIAKLYLPASFARLDVEPDDVTIELPRELRVGRKSVKVSVRGQRTVYIPVTIAPLVEVAICERSLAVGATIGIADVRLETRAVETGSPAPGRAVIGARVTRSIAADRVVGTGDIALPPPLPRGSDVTVEIRRGAVRVHGTGTLELVARIGETATVRINKTVVRGTLVAPSTVVVGDNP